MTKLTTINSQQWIDRHSPLLKPSVSNHYILGQDPASLVNGGPNSYFNKSQKLFYQIKGDAALTVVKEGKPYWLAIKKGAISPLPSLPHLPQHPACSAALVIERQTTRGESGRRSLRFKKSSFLRNEEYSQLMNITRQSSPLIHRFYDDPEHSTERKGNARLECPKLRH